MGRNTMNGTRNYRTVARLVLVAAISGDLLARSVASQAAIYAYTDLNPTGFAYSYATGNSASQQIGYGIASVTAYRDHALLWSGTASSVADLNPSGFTVSYV